MKPCAWVWKRNGLCYFCPSNYSELPILMVNLHVFGHAFFWKPHGCPVSLPRTYYLAPNHLTRQLHEWKQHIIMANKSKAVIIAITLTNSHNHDHDGSPFGCPATYYIVTYSISLSLAGTQCDTDLICESLLQWLRWALWSGIVLYVAWYAIWVASHDFYSDICSADSLHRQLAWAVHGHHTASATARTTWRRLVHFSTLEQPRFIARPQMEA